MTSHLSFFSFFFLFFLNIFFDLSLCIHRFYDECWEVNLSLDNRGVEVTIENHYNTNIKFYSGSKGQYVGPLTPYTPHFGD